MQAPTRSQNRSKAWPSSTIRTSTTAIRAPRSASRRSPRLATYCSMISSAASMTGPARHRALTVQSFPWAATLPRHGSLPALRPARAPGRPGRRAPGLAGHSPLRPRLALGPARAPGRPGRRTPGLAGRRPLRLRLALGPARAPGLAGHSPLRLRLRAARGPERPGQRAPGLAGHRPPRLHRHPERAPVRPGRQIAALGIRAAGPAGALLP
jgi:hypothetical protein